MIRFSFMNCFAKIFPKTAKQADTSLSPAVEIIEKAGQRQPIRSQYYYNTLAKEFETPRSFYNTHTGNTTHIYDINDSRLVSVSRNNKILLSIDRSKPSLW